MRYDLQQLQSQGTEENEQVPKKEETPAVEKASKSSSLNELLDKIEKSQQQ